MIQPVGRRSGEKLPAWNFLRVQAMSDALRFSLLFGIVLVISPVRFNSLEFTQLLCNKFGRDALSWWDGRSDCWPKRDRVNCFADSGYSPAVRMRRGDPPAFDISLIGRAALWVMWPILLELGIWNCLSSLGWERTARSRYGLLAVFGACIGFLRWSSMMPF